MVRVTASGWVRATWLGWLAGIPLIIVFALIGEAISIGGTQVLVGLGMGTGVGLMQGRLLRGMLGSPAQWLWSCVVGLSAPFLVADIARAAGFSLPYALQVCVALGGLTAGLWQARLLRPHTTRSGRWVVASLLGWLLAAASAAAADSLPRTTALRGITGALIYLGIIAAGGLGLGAVTGLAMGKMLPSTEGAHVPDSR